jgi:2,5-diamino-6-(ribosylamino)-4(3H)-pyrimidinone 5'-phosphate reductase
MLDIPTTTLFLIQSLDGKISTGDAETLDVDKDYKRISGLKEGLHQYYELELKTDFVSFNSGRVQEKMGVNQKTWDQESTAVNFVIVDNKPHLTKQGSEYFAKKSKKFFLVTTNKNHPAYSLREKYSNIHILQYDKEIDFIDVFQRFKKEFGIKRVTIQTGGDLNAKLLRLGLIDRVSIVIAPCLVGGRNTQSLIGGESLHNEEDLRNIKALKLITSSTLENSYINLVYKVLNETVVE